MTAVPELTSDVAANSVDDAGLSISPDVRGPLVVSLDGQYVWSLTPTRDGRLRGSTRFVSWPDALRPHLHGRARVAVTDPTRAVTWFDQEVRLGSGVGRIRVVDPSGHPLCVDKVGHLARAFSATDPGVREEILVGTGRALRNLREGCEVEAYLNYGLLLGAVRDGAMIAHDSDVDLCYFSRHSSPADLIGESYRIERQLRDAGWRALRMSGGDIKLLLPLSDGRTCHIDVFAAFRVGETFYQLGNRSGRIPTSAILPTSTIELHGHHFPAPADPEAMLAFLYGPGWRVPDPSFKYADPREGVRRLDGWLRGFRTHMGRWSQFFQGEQVGAVPRQGSDFARWVHRQLEPRDAVADLGSGSGRDALFFAARGRRSRAYDFSRPARGTVRKRASRRHLQLDVHPLILGELRTVLAVGADLAREQRHLYARHLIGCLDEAERHNLWLLARMALRGGHSLFLEFAALGEGVAEPVPDGLVRRLDPKDVSREIAAAGGVVEHLEVGPGEDMYDDPDPRVCRMRVTWRRQEEDR